MARRATPAITGSCSSELRRALEWESWRRFLKSLECSSSTHSDGQTRSVCEDQANQPSIDPGSNKQKMGMNTVVVEVGSRHSARGPIPITWRPSTESREIIESTQAHRSVLALRIYESAGVSPVHLHLKAE